LADLSLTPEHRRGHGGLYDGINSGRIEVERLQVALAGLPLPRAADDRLVLAVDVSPWLRPDAATSADRLFCHVYGRGKGQAQMIPGWLAARPMAWAVAAGSVNRCTVTPSSGVAVSFSDSHSAAQPVPRKRSTRFCPSMRGRGSPGDLGDGRHELGRPPDSHAVIGHSRRQRVGAAFRHDLTVVDRQDPVAQRVGLVQVVGGQEDGDAVVGVQSPDVLPQAPTRRLQAVR
jgi:hypothetical protein